VYGPADNWNAVGSSLQVGSGTKDDVTDGDVLPLVLDTGGCSRWPSEQLFIN
jgi:hypothetical protein